MAEQSELGTVRNGSEPARRGRRPRVADEDLMDLVRTLAMRSGELPTLDAIISEAGGCQRSRAVKARQRFADEQLANDIRHTLHLPAEIDLAHRRLMAQWLDIAHDHLQAFAAQKVCKAQFRATDLELALQDLRGHAEALEAELERVATAKDALTVQNEQLAQSLATLQPELACWKGIAQERERVIHQLTNI